MWELTVFGFEDWPTTRMLIRDLLPASRALEVAHALGYTVWLRWQPDSIDRNGTEAGRAERLLEVLVAIAGEEAA